MKGRILLILVSVAFCTLPAQAQSATELRAQGIAAFSQGHASQAIQLFRRLVGIAPTGENFSYLATAELRGQQLRPAIADFEKAVHLGYGSGSVHYNLGIAYLREHEAAAGIRHLRRAVELEPQAATIRYTLGVALLDAGQARQALPYLDPRHEKNVDPSQWANFVRAEFEATETKAALDSIDTATGLRPNDLPLAVTLARLCLQHGQAQKARYLLENASALAPQDADISLLLAHASLAAGEPIEAIAVLKNVPSTHGEPGEWHALHSQALARTGKLDEARTEIEEARRAAPGNADFLLADARILQQLGKYADSIPLLEQAQKVHPRLAAIPYRIAVADFLLRRYEPAKQQCAAALTIAPGDAAAWFLQGIVHLDAHEFPDARSSLERAVQLDQRSALYRTELGIALLKMGDAAHANEQLNQALRIAPKSPNAYYWRAMALEQMQKPRSAIADLETAVALEPDYADAFYELAQLYHATGQSEKAAAALARNQALKAQRLHRDRQRLLQQIAPE